MLRGRTIDVFAISCLYVACREAGLPKTLQSFVGETYSRRTDITAYYRLILKTLDIKTSVQSPIVFIGKIASNVNPPISQAIQRLAQDIINKYDNTAGKDPIGLAAASLYIASMIKGLGMTQRDIALASDVTEVTIRNRFKDLFRCYQEKENNQEINDLTEKLISLQNYFEQTRD
jgi:transcription initiation factor TFIIB